MKVKIKKLHPDAQIPKQMSPLAAGWDVVCTKIETIHEDFVICYLGFALQPPSNYRIVLVPRSSLTNSSWVLQNTPGTGDPDYLGEYQYRFRCIPKIKDGIAVYPSLPYTVGDRVGQIYLQEIIPVAFEEVDELIPSERGCGGFGSTGI